MQMYVSIYSPGFRKLCLGFQIFEFVFLNLPIFKKQYIYTLHAYPARLFEFPPLLSAVDPTPGRAGHDGARKHSNTLHACLARLFEISNSHTLHAFLNSPPGSGSYPWSGWP